MFAAFLALFAGMTPADEATVALALARAARERQAIVVPVKTAPVRKAATHSHKCARCGTEWWHADDSFGKIAEHSCPRCGLVQWQVNQRVRP